MKMLIKNAKIITQNPSREIVSNGYISIKNGVITGVGHDNQVRKSQKNRNIKIINASGYTIAPGLINAHVHLGESAYANFLANRYDLKKYLYLTENLSRLSEKFELNRECVSEYSLLHLLKNGTTTICGGRTHKSAEKFGIRNVSGYILMQSYKLKKYSTNIIAQFVKEGETIDRSLTKQAIFIHSLIAVDKGIIMRVKGLTKKYPNSLIIVHAAETNDSEENNKKIWGSGAIETLNRFGLLNNRSVIIHGGNLSSHDIDLIKRANAAIVHCLSSNLKVADTTADIKILHKKGIKVCIATDGIATSGTLNILSEARACYLYHNRFSHSKIFISSQKIFDMITIDAACTLGMQNEVGSIEIGKKADLIFFKMPFNNKEPVENLIFNADMISISGVMINGDLRVWNGKTLFMNEDSIVSKFINLGNDINTDIIKSGRNFPYDF